MGLHDNASSCKFHHHHCHHHHQPYNKDVKACQGRTKPMLIFLICTPFHFDLYYICICTFFIFICIICFNYICISMGKMERRYVQNVKLNWFWICIQHYNFCFIVFLFLFWIWISNTNLCVSFCFFF